MRRITRPPHNNLIIISHNITIRNTSFALISLSIEANLLLLLSSRSKGSHETVREGGGELVSDASSNPDGIARITNQAGGVDVHVCT